MSILNVLLRPDQLLIAVDTLAEDALTGAPSAGAKLLLIPQHNLVLATRGSAQFFLRIYELALPASFRADFTMEQLGRELGLVIDQLWPAYEKAALEAGVARSAIGTELVFGGWSPHAPRMGATAYAKSVSGELTRVQPPGGGLASPGAPPRRQKRQLRPKGRSGGWAAAGHLAQRPGREDRGRWSPLGRGPAPGAGGCPRSWRHLVALVATSPWQCRCGGLINLDTR